MNQTVQALTISANDISTTLIKIFFYAYDEGEDGGYVVVEMLVN